VLNIILSVGRGWGSRSSTLSDHARYLAQSAKIMRRTIGATRRSTFSRRASSLVQLVPWFPIAAPNNSARTRERRVVPRGQGAMGQASQAGYSVQYGPCSQPPSRALSKEASTEEAVEYRL
jgi:hypothetical protein